MRIFLTGATGYIGAAVLDALVRAGHDVTALVRDNEKAARIAARGGHPVIANLAEPASFRGAAEAQDGYVHAAFDSSPGRGPAIEKAALETIIAAAKRPRTAGAAAIPRFIIYTSASWILGKAPEPVGEDAAINPIAMASFRPAHEQLVLSAATTHLRYLRTSRSTGTMFARMLRWVMTTPFGSAVAPDVKMISATSSRPMVTGGAAGGL